MRTLHPMRHALLLRTWAVTLCLAALPRLAVAAGVQNIRASEQDGQIRIQWDTPATGTVAAYNVYFSGRSILRNSGEYDDYEKVSGSRTEFILTDYPKSTGSVYIAVLPVDAQGKEMDTFTEETRVALGLQNTPPTASSVPSNSLEVRNLEVRAEPQPNGRFLVMAAWDPPQGSFASYVVRKSRDGVPVGTPQTISFSNTFTRFTDEPAARLTITIQTVAPSGALSAGQSASIDLVPPPNYTPAPTPTPRGGKLTSSGLGVVGVMAVTGAIAGMWRGKRRRRLSP